MNKNFMLNTNGKVRSNNQNLSQMNILEWFKFFGWRIFRNSLTDIKENFLDALEYLGKFLFGIVTIIFFIPLASFTAHREIKKAKEKIEEREKIVKPKAEEFF